MIVPGRVSIRGRSMSSFQIDDEFAGEVLQHKWCQQEKGHFATKSAGAGKVYLHRFVWGLKHGTVPQIIDHINGDPTDNRLANLRPADFTLNNGNRRMRKPTRCGLPRGVDQVGVRFRARIRESGARVFIGLFDTAEEASAAYERAFSERSKVLARKCSEEFLTTQEMEVCQSK